MAAASMLQRMHTQNAESIAGNAAEYPVSAAHESRAPD
jgi:hypothetical protein